MELRQLEYFVAVVEEANFTRAAARLHVAQPGVSAQVRKLERKFGQELLDRSGRSVRLTEAGRVVLPYARSALAAADGARLAVDELTGLVRGHVAVGMVVSISSTTLDLPGLLADFHEEYPAVRITLTEDNSDLMIESIRDGRLDVGFIGLSSAGSPPGIETRLIYDDPLVVAVSLDDPLAAKDSIPLEDIRERDVIGLPKGTGLRSAIDGACAEAGFRPRMAFEATDPEVLASLAGRGLGVAVLPESIVRARPAELKTIRLSSPRPRGRIALAWRSGGATSPAARAFVDHTSAVWARPAPRSV